MANSKTIIKDDFDNLIQFRKWVKDNEQLLANSPYAGYFRRKDTLETIRDGFLGEELRKMPEEDAWQMVSSGIETYEHMDLIEEMENKLNQSISLKDRNPIPKKKLSYNDLGLGVFSFDRAAQGMYRLTELYSPIHSQVVQPEEVIRSTMDIRLKRDNSLVEERLELKESGKPRLRTTSKKVWAYFPKVKRQRAAAEIYLSCGNYSNVSAKEFLYSGMVAIIIAKKLITASIPVRINLVIGWEVNGKYSCAIVPVKDYNEPLDVNLLALTSSDPRFWRYEGFKACTLLQLVNKRTVGGAGLTGADLKKYLEAAGYKLDVPNRFYFGRVANASEAESHTRNAIAQINRSLEA
jgi:hypothetical protein